MKKQLFVLLFILLFTLCLLSGCAASKGGVPAIIEKAATQAAAPPIYNSDIAFSKDSDMNYGYIESEDGEYGYATIDSAGGIDDVIRAASVTANTSDKIIYNANAEVETLDFSGTVDNVYALVEQYGAFIESSNISGNNYSSKYYGHTSRTAYFTVRVPKDHYSNFANDVKLIGNVVSFYSEAQNITSQFIDTQSRLDMYKVEEDRLLALLEKAETIEDMLTIEARLSDIRYNNETLTRQLSDWQHQVDYSTVRLNLYEVRELTPEPLEEPKTLGEEIRSAFSRSLEGMVSFLRSSLILFFASLPILALPVLLGVIILIIFFVHRKKKRSEKQNNGE